VTTQESKRSGEDGVQMPMKEARYELNQSGLGLGQMVISYGYGIES
jgi:hypothetical protein